MNANRVPANPLQIKIGGSTAFAFSADVTPDYVCKGPFLEKIGLSSNSAMIGSTTIGTLIAGVVAHYSDSK